MEDEPAQTVPRKGWKPAKVSNAMVDIVVSENEDIPPTGLFIGLNGKGWLIRPGEKVSVPQGIVDILDNAITSVPQVDPGSRQVVGYRDRMRYPYQRVS